MSEQPEPRKTFYPVDDFDRATLKNPATAVLNYGYTDVTDATTHVLKSRRGHQPA